MFFSNLAKICKEQNIKITPLLNELNISTGSIGRWQKGVIPNGETLIKLSKRLNCSIDYLLEQNDTPYIPTEPRNTSTDIVDERASIAEFLDIVRTGNFSQASVTFNKNGKQRKIELTNEEFEEAIKIADESEKGK